MRRPARDSLQGDNFPGVGARDRSIRGFRRKLRESGGLWEDPVFRSRSQINGLPDQDTGSRCKKVKKLKIGVDTNLDRDILP